MPINDKDLGKYNRPDIFINEINNSIITLPVQETLTNLVPGFSKKGPVNRPVYVTSPTEFKTIFGDIDRGLERKGSYFHRTCLKMLQSGPIWALNLLITDDTRDKLSWKSISCGSAYANDITRTMPYSRVFNRQDFWNRDDESFLDYVNDPTPDTTRLLHITNLGEKTITVFSYKSKTSGFDVTAENWYGGVTKVPAYIHPKDWISDYMVSVLVLEGDWTDYNSLSVDTTWSKYFTTTGLNKSVIQNFVNETNVTTLAYYDASLIPYFKDISGRDMYIKSIINNNTDKTGLFCAFNEELLLDSDYPTGKMDLIGDGLVGLSNTTIDFLSYNESIIESLSYTQKPLDTLGNVFGNYSTDMSTDKFASLDSRTGANTNWYVNGASIVPSTTGVTTTKTTLLNIEGVSDSSGKSWLYIPNTVHASATTYHDFFQQGDAVYLNVTYNELTANIKYYICETTQSATWFSLSTSYANAMAGISISITNGTPSNLFIQRIDIGVSLTNPTFNLNGQQYTMTTATTSYTFEPLEFTSLTNHGYERYDVLYLTAGNDATVNILKGTQSDSSAAVKPSFTTDYNSAIILGYVHHYIMTGATSGYSYTDNYILSDYTPVTLDSTGYLTLTDITMSGYTMNNTNYIKLIFGNTLGTSSLTDYNKLRYRAAYNEMETYLSESKGVLINASTGYKYYIQNATFTDYSTQYNATISIPIGTGSATSYHESATYEWLIYYLDNEFYLTDLKTDRFMTTLAPVENLTGSGNTWNAGVIGIYSNVYLDYYNGIINNGNYGYINNISGTTGTQMFIKAWIQDTDKVYIDLMNSDGTSTEPIEDWSTSYNNIFNIWSNISNYKQTIEIEYIDIAKLYTNLVYEMKIDKIRYSEVKKGDFIEAYYNEADYEQGGSLYGTDPRKLTRIIDVKIDSTNSSWKIIKTDAPIKITTVATTTGGYDYQTTLYPQIDVYVSTYKGIKLTPFTIHADSMPISTTGKEERLSSILDVMGKTTNLAKGLVNKNKISWRYMVDSFGNGLTSTSKQQYADICGLKLNCLGFINAPSAKDFKKSSNPSFINDDRTLNTTYLKAGGNEDLNPSFLYSFAEGDGRSCVAYFFPYVTVDDNGIPKDVPPSAHVATTYMNKHLSTSSSVEPWTICAGINDGRITNISNVEMDFSDDDLANLNSMNLNPIVKKKNAGYCINTESTAQVFPYSTLSIIHAREVLIELENSLYDMLLRYQWRFNTPEVRAEIKYRADKICKDLQDRNALYDFTNIIDETNNTDYLIDLQFGCLDTYVEVIRGMGTIVNNITILKKGDIQSGGFM